MTILVMSCDKNEDLWLPFSYCICKYWPEHPKVIYSTETKENPLFTTITNNVPISEWSRRVKEAVEQIDDDSILLMCDDIFIRSPVDNNLMNYLNDLVVNKDIAAINFEYPFDKKDTPYNAVLQERSKQGRYKTSVMCGLWNKEKMLKVFDVSLDPWAFEQLNNHCGYRYLISSARPLLDFGLTCNGSIFGVFQGKWAIEAVAFFEKENFKINLSRGITNKLHY